MLTEKFFFLQKLLFMLYQLWITTTIGKNINPEKNSVNLEEEKFKSWNKSGRQLKNASKD